MNAILCLVSCILSCSSPGSGPPKGIEVATSENKIVVTFRPPLRDVMEKLTNEQVIWICKLPRIDYLDLTSSHVSQSQLNTICRHVDLRGISLVDNNLNDEAIRVLASEKKITRLNLDASGVSGQNLRPLQACKELSSLWIGHEEWKCDVDAETLRKITSLRKLVITAKTISNKEIKKLGSLSQLRVLSLFVVNPQEDLYSLLRDQDQLRATLVIYPQKAGPFGWPLRRKKKVSK